MTFPYIYYEHYAYILLPINPKIGKIHKGEESWGFIRHLKPKL